MIDCQDLGETTISRIAVYVLIALVAARSVPSGQRYVEYVSEYEVTCVMSQLDLGVDSDEKHFEHL